ncbi:hypothetical protein ACWDYH_36335 [Nocardia goodfellowii]
MRTEARYNSAYREFRQGRARAFEEFERAYAQWSAQVDTHDRHEQHRISSTMLWFPVRVGARQRRVDVFGGDADGWASLLATVGMSLLSAGERVLVLDYTEQQVAADFAALARDRAHAVNFTELPAENLAVLGDLCAADIAEVIAETLQGIRGGEPNPQLRSLDAEFVELVAASLAAPITFARLAAGIRLLRKLYDGDNESMLSATEIHRINALVDAVGPSETAREELRFLGGVLGLLAHDAQPATPLHWPRSGLSVVATADANPRRKDLVDRLVVHRLTYDLRSGAIGDQATVLVVAGADHLGLSVVEALARHARRCGVRLILMFEHARGELTQLLGGADSATVLMRMGNAAEAAAAADFVGRGYRFTLSQLTEQIGRSFTTGVADSTGSSVTNTSSDGYSGTTANSSEAFSRAQTWSSTVNWSNANSTSSSHTYSRAYEYTVEPTTFQALPSTAFVLVENHHGGWRVVSGDCNPGIALLDRVARTPRTALARAR